MTDVKKEVKLEFTADTTGVKRAMQEFAAYQKEMSQNASKIASTGLKSHKDVAKFAKKTQKFEKLTRGRKAVQAEKTLFQAIKKTTGEVVKRQKAYKGIVKGMDQMKGRMRAVTVEAKKAGTEMKKAMNFFGFGGGGGGSGGGGGGRGGRGGGRFAGTKGFFKKLLGGITGMLMGGVMGLLGGAFGLLTGQLSGGYSERMQFGRQYGQLAGTGGRLRNVRSQMGFGSRMGFGGIEMAQQALPFARATGVVGGDALRQGMALQRATSMNAGEAAGFMGMLTQAGTGFGGKAGKTGKAELVKTLALGVYSGLDRARMPEFLASTTQLVQRQMGVSAGTVSSNAASRLLAMLGASGQSGLQGARGGQVAAALDKAIRNPGGGEAGQAFMLQAMGFGKPGGGASYYEALRKQEQGVFGAGNLEAMFAESQSQYGGGQAQILALRQLTGLSIDQLEAVRDVVNSNMSGTEKAEALKKIEEEAKSIEEQALDEMKEFGDTTRHMAELQNRSIGIGDDIKESVEDIQRVINELISEFMPQIAAALRTIADVIQELWAYLRPFLERQFSEEEKAEIEQNLQEVLGSGRSETDKYIKETGERIRGLERQAAESGPLEVAGVAGAKARGVMDAVWNTLSTGRSDQDLDELIDRRVRETTVGSRRQRIDALSSARSTAQESIRTMTPDAAEAGLLARIQNRRRYDVDDEELARLREALTQLRSAVESDNDARIEREVAQSRALADAIDESRRNRAGSPPNEDRDSPRTPTRTGRGR